MWMGRTGSYREYTGVGTYSDIFLTSHAQSIKRAVNSPFKVYPKFTWGFPGGTVVKNLPADAGNSRRRFNPWVLGEGNGKLLQYSCLASSTDRGTWRATVHGVTKSGT